MLDQSPAPVLMQRSRGRAVVALSGTGRVERLHQSGSAKAILPRTHGAPPEVVFLNTSGGLTGGDRLDLSLVLAPGLRATATTQTAERAYDAGTGIPARVEVALTVGAGGFVDWLPQETILFENAALERAVTVDLGPGAGCLFLESVVLGRRAMGEDLRRLRFLDRRTVRRAGRPVWAEPLALDGARLARADGTAMLGGARAFATLALVADGAEARLDALRAVLDEPGVEAGASAFDGKCICRMLAADGWPLRRQVARALAVLRPGPLPRVWQI
ncbi:MAG TPA: urease accessory protein UreD [Paracoccaceae bacterium]|nr:urease accessory protein UreD [Paracoccaceae bacterium]